MSTKLNPVAMALVAILTCGAAGFPASADRGDRSDRRSSDSSAASGPVWDDVRVQLKSEGFKLIRFDTEDGMIEAKGYEADGTCVEVYFDRRTGDELFREFEDNCDREQRRSDRRSR